VTTNHIQLVNHASKMRKKEEKKWRRSRRDKWCQITYYFL